MLPPAGLPDTGAAPKAGRAVEIEKPAAAAARRLLQKQMAIEKHGLNTGEERVTAVEMTPSGLNHPYLGIGEKMDSTLEQVGSRDKISVQNTNEVPRGRFEANRQRPGLEAGTIHAVNQLDVETPL